jgi:osmoprotectant transport system ATP-binding protein
VNATAGGSRRAAADASAGGDGSAAAPIHLEGVRKVYPGAFVAVSNLSLDIPAGEIVVLVGPSGCGKSTILRMVNRLVEPTAGRIVLGEEDVTHVDPVRLRRRMGYVIQHVGLFPHQTVRENVATVPRLLGWPRERISARVEELLELVGLPPAQFARRYPHELSGGQRQRVGVARALGADPVVLLMDEPFSAVDPIVRARLQEEFLRLQATVGKTILFVTHDVDEAVRLGDRIAVLSDHGHLEQYAPPAQVLASPANAFVAEFVGSDRGIKRLGVTPIPAVLEPMPAGAVGGWPTVASGATLRDALAALFQGGAGRVAVVGPDGTVRGALTATSIHAALAAAAEELPGSRA